MTRRHRYVMLFSALALATLIALPAALHELLRPRWRPGGSVRVVVREVARHVPEFGFAPDPHATEGYSADPYSISADGTRFAYVTPLEGKVAVVVDGRAGAPFDEILQYCPSSDIKGGDLHYAMAWDMAGRNFAYAAASSGKKFIVVNGKENGPYDEVRLFRHQGRLPFYGDCDRLFYAARRAGKWTIVTETGEYGPFDDVPLRELERVIPVPGLATASFVTARSGEHFACHVLIDGRHHVATDMRILGPYNDEPRMELSPDGARLAVYAHRDGQAIVEIDGVAHPASGSVRPFSSDGKHTAYIAPKPGGKCALMVDGKEVAQAEEFGYRWSCDAQGSLPAHSLRRGKEWYAVVAGKEYGPSARQPDIMTAPGARFVIRNDNACILVDVETAETTDSSLPPHFSPDGLRVCSLVAQRHAQRLVIDGRAGPLYNNIREFAFSPDSRHFYYTATGRAFRERVPRWLYWIMWRFFPEGDGEYVIVDGEKFGPYKARVRLLPFTPDSGHVVWFVRGGSEDVMYVDGVPKAWQPSVGRVIYSWHPEGDSYREIRQHGDQIIVTEARLEPE